MARKRTKEIFSRFDAVDYLTSDEDMVAYLEACWEEAGDDPAFIAATLGDIARARGMMQLANETGLTREGLYKALSAEGNPSLGVVLKVVRALGLKLKPEIADAHRVAETAAAYMVPGFPRARPRGRSKVGRRGGDGSGGPTLPDRPPQPGGVLLVGLNPAPPSVVAGHYYQGQLGRRLWKRLVHVGLLTDPVPGSEDDAFVASGHGLTDLVKRPTSSARELGRGELQLGAEELRAKVRDWRPGLVLFVFRQAANLALGSLISAGKGPALAGAPTFLLSGPYAARDEADRVNEELRDVLSVKMGTVPQAVTTQRVTASDLAAGIVRLPRMAKALLPDRKSNVPITLRGKRLTVSYDPKRGRDRERSAVLRIGEAHLRFLVKVGERLRVSIGPNARLQFD